MSDYKIMDFYTFTLKNDLIETLNKYHFWSQNPDLENLEKIIKKMNTNMYDPELFIQKTLDMLVYFAMNRDFLINLPDESDNTELYSTCSAYYKKNLKQVNDSVKDFKYKEIR